MEVYSSTLANTLFLCDWLRIANLLFPIEPKEETAKPFTCFKWFKEIGGRVYSIDFVGELKGIPDDVITVIGEKNGKGESTGRNIIRRKNYSEKCSFDKDEPIVKFVMELAVELGGEGFDRFVNSRYALSQPMSSVSKSSDVKDYSENVIKEVTLNSSNASELGRIIKEDIESENVFREFMRKLSTPADKADEDILETYINFMLSKCSIELCRADENDYADIKKEALKGGAKAKIHILNQVSLGLEENKGGSNNSTGTEALNEECTKIKKAMISYVNAVIAEASSICDSFYEEDVLDLKALAERYRLQVIK